MFRALVFVAVFLLACTDRPVEQETDSGNSSSTTGAPEQEILQRRCDLLIECGYGPSYPTVNACVLDQEMRLSHWETPECAPALLDFFACGNKADSCEAYWVLHSLVENINGECRPVKDEVCRWDCGCVGTDHDS
ncbi:hypothetical protein OV203_10885 [Nannocystis sp. ILAH1]|uniref:hypothetical protein n=1 Tax=unclassified Nannocystis TaxID=2627009 RepID=UPI00226DD223|nr:MULTISPECIES: hypothetical protein [unclassified Nannocystis]MCY0987632.1 hypothetical protein [Nannocystis sp. ILAH1]MCY1070566.1 hypothetical protein [Nannocystis sp. RBIL2]